MEELKQILLQHSARYPLMAPTDAVKLIYQNEFGGGHMIRDEAACLRYLRDEYASVAPEPCVPAIEEIGNGIVRVMLSAMDTEVYPLEQLGRDFIAGAQLHRGSLPSFLEKLEILRELVQTGTFSFSPEELEAYLLEYEKAGYPPVSHSSQYRAAYHPAYRIVLRSMLPVTILARYDQCE